MHSAHRDLESKYKRVLTELANTNKHLSMANTKLTERNTEITQLKTTKAEYEATITAHTETIASTRRDIDIKSKQIKDLDQRYTITNTELESFRHRIQDLQKSNT